MSTLITVSIARRRRAVLVDQVVLAVSAVPVVLAVLVVPAQIGSITRRIAAALPIRIVRQQIATAVRRAVTPPPIAKRKHGSRFLLRAAM